MEPHLNNARTAPTFLVAGVAKAGTTSLYEYLVQHPEVFIPDIKESFYFVSDIYKSLSRDDPHGDTIRARTLYTAADYYRLFEAGRQCPAVGEVGTFYAYHHRTSIPWIRRELGDIPILLILRDPIDRAFSAYCHFRGYGVETLSFEDAIATEDQRIRDGWYTMWHYRRVGLYSEQVAAFQAAFSRVLVCRHDDFARDPAELMRTVYTFIGVDPQFDPDVSVRFMVSGQPRNATLNALSSPSERMKRIAGPPLRRLLPERWRHRIKNRIRMNNLVKPELPAVVRKQLAAFYREDVRKLQQQTGLDVSHWLRSA